MAEEGGWRAAKDEEDEMYTYGSTYAMAYDNTTDSPLSRGGHKRQVEVSSGLAKLQCPSTQETLAGSAYPNQAFLRQEALQDSWHESAPKPVS
jgi:hypothetical protein